MIIIGGGPAGLAAADEADQKGLNYLWLEQGRFLQNIEDVYPDDKLVLLKGWDPKFDIELQTRFPMRDMSKTDLLSLWRNYVKSTDLSLLENMQIFLITRQETSFIICSADEKCWQADHVVMAAGRISQPNKLGVPGEDLTKVHYNLRRSDQYENQEILVVGGGDTAIEVALKLAEDNRVRLSYRRSKFQAERLHPSNYQLIQQAIVDNKITVHFNSKVKKITKDFVILSPTEESDPGWETQDYYKNEEVFVCIGSQKPALNILQGMVLALNKKGLPEIMDGCCTTSVPNIHVIGDLRVDPVYKRGSIAKSVWEGQMVIREVFS